MASTFDDRESLASVRAKINNSILNAENLRTRVEALESIGVSVNWNDLTGKPSEFPPNPHTHQISEIVDLVDELDLKAGVVHTHTVSDITDAGALASKNMVAVSDISASGTPSSNNYLLGDGSWGTVPDDPVQWGDVQNKPASFPPSAHTHAAVTTTVDGFMTSTDKIKLNGIASGAQVNTVDSVAGKTGVVSLTAADVGLQVTTSPTDTTSGRLLKVGDFGLGAMGPLIGNSSVTDLSIAPGTYSYNANAGSSGGPANMVRGTLVHQRSAANGHETQLFLATEATPGSPLAGSVFTRFRETSGWSSWARSFTNRNVLGEVGQASGVPTGALIERGSSANGEYTRFADGTLICTIKVDCTSEAWTTASGSLFRNSDRTTWTFPAAFSSAPTVNMTAETIGASGVVGASCTGVSNTTCFFRGWAAVSTAAAVAKTVHLTAIGCWY